MSTATRTPAAPKGVHFTVASSPELSVLMQWTGDTRAGSFTAKEPWMVPRTSCAAGGLGVRRMKSVWVISNVSACVLTVLVMIWRPHDGQTTEIALAALIPDESASAAENDCKGPV
jgi:hypothetical protein